MCCSVADFAVVCAAGNNALVDAVVSNHLDAVNYLTSRKYVDLDNISTFLPTSLLHMGPLCSFTNFQ